MGKNSGTIKTSWLDSLTVDDLREFMSTYHNAEFIYRLGFKSDHDSGVPYAFACGSEYNGRHINSYLGEHSFVDFDESGKVFENFGKMLEPSDDFRGYKVNKFITEWNRLVASKNEGNRMVYSMDGDRKIVPAEEAKFGKYFRVLDYYGDLQFKYNRFLSSEKSRLVEEMSRLKDKHDVIADFANSENDNIGEFGRR